MNSKGIADIALKPIAAWNVRAAAITDQTVSFLIGSRNENSVALKITPKISIRLEWRDHMLPAEGFVFIEPDVILSDDEISIREPMASFYARRQRLHGLKLHEVIDLPFLPDAEIISSEYHFGMGCYRFSDVPNVSFNALIETLQKEIAAGTLPKSFKDAGSRKQ